MSGDAIAPNPFFKAGNVAVDAAGEVANVAGDVLEAGKPLPVASPEEQKRRQDMLREAIKNKVNENFKNNN